MTGPDIPNETTLTVWIVRESDVSTRTCSILTGVFALRFLVVGVVAVVVAVACKLLLLETGWPGCALRMWDLRFVLVEKQCWQRSHRNGRI